MSKPIETLLPMVLPYAHSCPEIIGIEAIRNAAIEFCERSLWVQEQVPPITPIAGTSSYQLIPADPSATDVAEIMHLWLGPRELIASSVDKLADSFGRDWRTITAAPQYFTTIESQSIVVLAPTPDVGATTSTLNAIIAIRPLRTATTLSNDLVERWAEAIAYGARARLHQIMRQPWYDMPMAVAEQREFRALIAEATIKRNKGATREITVVRPRRL